MGKKYCMHCGNELSCSEHGFYCDNIDCINYDVDILAYEGQELITDYIIYA